jgi:hopene-associated glycosyltransferase HpnB
MRIAWVVAAGSLVSWIVLLLFRGGYWRTRPLLDESPPESPSPRKGWPSVVAVIPARNEEGVIGESLPTVLSQGYSGPFHVVLVSDRSEDATVDVARAAAARLGRAARLSVVLGELLPAGWAGKVWAMAQGAARPAARRADYVWFTDADIVHDAGVLCALVAKAEADRVDLVSVMARLRVDTRWDRLLIPAFVYFFSKLYPFRFVNDERRRSAGAAGGCMLVRRETLERAGGVERIRAALIDDCALGRLIKRSGGRVWLGFTTSVRSVRQYGTLRSTWDMVARSAYTQLRHSPFLLLCTALGMLFLYAVGPAALVAGLVASAFDVPGAVTLAWLGLATWSLMGLSFLPMLRHPGAGRWPALLLPWAGVLYVGMTIDSAWRHATGRGGSWRGRAHGVADAPTRGAE